LSSSAALLLDATGVFVSGAFVWARVSATPVQSIIINDIAINRFIGQSSLLVVSSSPIGKAIGVPRSLRNLHRPAERARQSI
jgi:hypothetical protein